jgi:hypothetical protein
LSYPRVVVGITSRGERPGPIRTGARGVEAHCSLPLSYGAEYGGSRDRTCGRAVRAYAVAGRCLTTRPCLRARVPACIWRGRAAHAVTGARAVGNGSGRRGSRTPKPVEATRFRDGVPRRWQSFRGATVGGARGSGRRRTCNPPVKSRELCLLSYGAMCVECGRQGSNLRRPRVSDGRSTGLSYGHAWRTGRPPSISPREEIDAVAADRLSSVARVGTTALFSMPLAHPSTLDRRPPADRARMVAVLRGGALEPDSRAVRKYRRANQGANPHRDIRANA